jgi:hypothetical protein
MSMSEPDGAKSLVVVSIFLFGKPAWELETLEGSRVDLELLEEVALCGRELHVRLSRAAELGTKLLGLGWEGIGLLYDIDFYKSISLEGAEEELRALGVEPGDVSIREEVEDQDARSQRD